MEFVTFDVETANSNRRSICSIGMVFYKDGEVEKTVYQLIDPKMQFNQYNINIHGIKPSDVEGMPTFKEFYEKIRHSLEGKILIAHNLSFDAYSLKDALDFSNTLSCTNHLICTLQISRKLLPELQSHKLNSLCSHFDIELKNHHNALDDALACCKLVECLQKKFGFVDFDSLLSEIGIEIGLIDSSNFDTPKVISTSKPKIKPKDLPTTNISLPSAPAGSEYDLNYYISCINILKSLGFNKIYFEDELFLQEFDTNNCSKEDEHRLKTIYFILLHQKEGMFDVITAPSQVVSYILYYNDWDIEKISSVREIRSETIVTHLIVCSNHGFVDLLNLRIDEELYDNVVSVFNKTSSLRSVHEALEIDYYIIKYILMKEKLYIERASWDKFMI